MADRIPDEILREILQLSFSIDVAKKFREWSWNLRSRGKILLVCKRWLRVATPLFYETVALRTETQVKSLASFVRANPLLGAMIRNLRIDGGYGRHLYTIVKHAPRIRAISVQLHVLSKDSNTGLLQALPCMDPTEIYVHNRARRRRDMNKKWQANKNAVVQAMSTWKSLVS